ncbi:hypothetical protein BGX27_009069 [Mortierella sp. AM989]|nr:hypothetical protein BGX27_009069 [Mortierella sp. AM989]
MGTFYYPDSTVVDAIHPLCTNCQTFKYDCTYNDPTKKRGPPKGYIEAIEARLHKMEGLLGGLVKDKDPRAEIVRAELDAMAREAEMTGLKLRRSKAYEEISHVMNTYSQVDSGSSVQRSQQSNTPLFEASRAFNYSNHHRTHPRQIQQRLQPHHSVNSNSSLQRPISPNQQIPPSISIQFTPANLPTTPDHSMARQPSQGYASTSIQQFLTQLELDNSLTSNSFSTYMEQEHQMRHQEPAPQVYYPNCSPAGYPQNIDKTKESSHDFGLDSGSHRLEESQHHSSTDQHSPTQQGRTGRGAGVMLPPANVMEHLLNIHFRFIHPVLPMLHQKTLLEQIHGNESIPSHLLLAVLGLASRFSESAVFRTPQPGSDRPPCTVYYEGAKQLIKEEYDNSHLETVQALLLMSIQQMGFCEGQRAWLYVGMAIRMAQDLGLNKKPSEQEQSRNRILSELRKRTWWSCYVVERHICAGLGRPLTITQQDCEIGYPQYDVEDVDLAAETVPSGQPVLISNFVHLITLSRIQGDILQFTRTRTVQCDESSDSHSPSPKLGSTDSYGRHLDTSQAAFFALDRSLTEWRQNLLEPLKNPTAQSSHFALFLHMTYNTLIILLHRPEFASSATSASLCNQAAATITDITEMLMKANALTSMFVSCLFAIFSAGLIHFINIPSAKHASKSSSACPTMAPAYTGSPNHASTAKADMKRCIDALKHLSTHWVSAARRAKVLEDLLDLKHVSLKDLEEDSFKTSPLMPSWAAETPHYAKALAAPGESQDRLRRQCRSKIMAIQSLLATDDEFRKIQSRSSFGTEATSAGHHGADNDDYGFGLQMDQLPADDNLMDILGGSPNLSMTRVHDGDYQTSSGETFTPTSASVALLTDMQSKELSLDADPMMLISTATFGTFGVSGNEGRDAEMSTAKSPSLYEPKKPMSPITLTTLGLESTNLSNDTSGSIPRSGSLFTAAVRASSSPPKQQASMLDPFSMPSSITFPSQGHGRQISCGGGILGCSSQPNTVWSTDIQTHRTIARAEPLPWPSKYCTTKGEELTKIGNFHQLTLSASLQENYCEEQECKDLELAWNDMPLTLGLDEWMAYIGALMMRWLASGQSSPRSIISN